MPDLHVQLAFSQPYTGFLDEEYDQILDASYNAWYDKHVGQVLELPGWCSVHRYARAFGERPGFDPPTKYLAIYEIDGPVDTSLAAQAAAAPGWLADQPAALELATVRWATYSAIGPRVTAETYGRTSELDPESRDHVLLMFSEPFHAIFAGAAYNNALFDSYDHWYDNKHLPEMLTVPGFVGVQRFRRHESEFDHPDFHTLPYFTRYDIAGDLETALIHMGQFIKTWAGELPAGLDVHSQMWWIYSAVSATVEGPAS